MADLRQTAKDINTLAAFCGPRDFPAPTRQALRQSCGIPQAEMLVLFGGSILCGGDVLAQAIQNGIARHTMIVGGAGHTTEALRRRIHAICPEISTEGRSEAECFAGYLQSRYGLQVDFLETHSTNCGNNVTFCLDLWQAHGLAPRSVILIQDASMQRRMEAVFRKYLGSTLLLNYAAYSARVAVQNGNLCFAGPPIAGMWEMERYLTLLLGEIPRLTDDANGYGPNGKNFLAHVEVPGSVRAAFVRLKAQYGSLVRAANPLFAAPQETLR